MAQPDDKAMQETIDRARTGDPQAQQELLSRHAGGLFRYAFHLCGSHADAEDLTQETLARAWKNLGGFRGDCAFEGWLFRIAMNLHLNRRRARRPEESLTHDPPAPASDRTGADEDVLARLRGAIERLPARQQEVILLHTYRQMESREIAAVLGCSYETVRMNLSHARRRLREILADDLEERRP